MIIQYNKLLRVMNIIDQLEIYVNIQNIQLLKYIADEEGWDIKELYKFIDLK